MRKVLVTLALAMLVAVAFVQPVSAAPSTTLRPINYIVRFLYMSGGTVTYTTVNGPVEETLSPYTLGYSVNTQWLPRGTIAMISVTPSNPMATPRSPRVHRGRRRGSETHC